MSDDDKRAAEKQAGTARDAAQDAPHGITAPAPADSSDGTERQQSPEPDLATPTGDDSKTPGGGQQGDYGAKGGKVAGTPVDWKGDSYDQIAEKPPSETAEDEDEDLGPTPHSGN